MHRYVVPASVKDRVVSRMGRLLAHDTIEAGRTALVVVDMQNYFCAQGFPAEVPLSREIVPNINRMAKTVRAAGGAVVWIQTTAVGALEHWRNYQTRMLTRHRQQARLAGLDEASEGFKLFPALEVLPGDIRVKKISYSAFMPGSSDIDAQLKARGIDTVLITGTATNVCCESTARRDAARLQGHHAVGRQRDIDRGGARGRAQHVHDVLRRRDEHRRGDHAAGTSSALQDYVRQ